MCGGGFIVVVAVSVVIHASTHKNCEGISSSKLVDCVVEAGVLPCCCTRTFV